MFKDHRGIYYSLDTDQEDEFDVIINQIRKNIIVNDVDEVKRLESKLDDQFGSCEIARSRYGNQTQ